MKFTPLRFQASLAAAGVALMSFLFMQFTIPHGKGLIQLQDISFANISIAHKTFLVSLIGIMLIFSIIHFILTAVFVKDLIHWLTNKQDNDIKNFLNTSPSNIAIFSPIISIAMSMNVFFGPVYFFLKTLTDNLQSIMLPALTFWFIFSIILLLLEAKMIKTFFNQKIKVEKLNFGFLLDTFAFGMVALAGSNIAILSVNKIIAATAAFLTGIVFFIGFLIFIIKFILLVKNQFKSSSLPEKVYIPSILMVVPIVCLFGISLYRINTYIRNTFQYDLSTLSYFSVIIFFLFTGIYILIVLYLTKDYFLKEFVKSEFYPSQWVIVCALVGFEVLGMYVYGNYHPTVWLYFLSYITILFATAIYFVILIRYLQIKSS